MKGFDAPGFGDDDDGDNASDNSPSYSPWDDAGGEGWKDNKSDKHGILAALRETAEKDFDETFRALALKFLWDMFFHVVKPSDTSIKHIVQSIVQCGRGQVVGQYSGYSKKIGEGLDSESLQAIEEACKEASKRFELIFTRPMLDKMFMEKVREAYRKGLKK